MTWRLHLTDSAIYRIEILHGTPDVLCVWLTDDRVTFFDLHTGTALDELSVAPPPDVTPDDADEWAAFLATLRAPNGVHLPYIRTAYGTVHRTTDGKHLLYDGGHGLRWQSVAGAHRLEHGEPFTVVRMDTATGAVVALDEHGKLHIHRRGQLTATCDTGMIASGRLPSLVVAAGGRRMVLTDGVQVLLISGTGDLLARQPMPYPVGQVGLSPDGQTCVTADSDTGVMRAYQGDALTFTHQKFAVDLFAAAAPVQLLAAVATPRLAVGTIALTSSGTLAFTLEGMVTVSRLGEMQRLPR